LVLDLTQQNGLKFAKFPHLDRCDLIDFSWGAIPRNMTDRARG